jgi:hypothetical protein
MASATSSGLCIPLLQPGVAFIFKQLIGHTDFIVSSYVPLPSMNNTFFISTTAHCIGQFTSPQALCSSDQLLQQSHIFPQMFLPNATPALLTSFNIHHHIQSPLNLFAQHAWSHSFILTFVIPALAPAASFTHTICVHTSTYLQFLFVFKFVCINFSVNVLQYFAWEMSSLSSSHHSCVSTSTIRLFPFHHFITWHHYH